ncbi:hypothetical protein Tco_0728662 [Tanacetum coccineum]|uniref:Uncharacterized protein n=1 Tax=Tanacetum coccineum TaxID=301880 RepID=A0ABQ4YP56_9ASTR
MGLKQLSCDWFRIPGGLGRVAVLVKRRALVLCHLGYGFTTEEVGELEVLDMQHRFVVKIVLGDTVCLRNGGLISWRLINLGSMKLILTEIGLVKISTSVLVEIALPVLVKVIPLVNF